RVEAPVYRDGNFRPLAARRVAVPPAFGGKPMLPSMTIRLSDAPVADHVRLHTERYDWDAPDVRYLLRKKTGRHPPVPPQHADEDVVFLFCDVEVTVRAVEDRVEVLLRHVPQRAALAA